MKTIIYTLTLITLASACNSGSELDSKIESLKELKSDLLELKAEIKVMEDEVLALDPNYGKSSVNAVLVTSIDIKPSYFEHEIEVRGAVESRTNVQVSAKIPGEIISVKVREGDYVKKGKILATLDDEIIRNNIDELETSLKLATIVSNKQGKLWKNNIGTELQYLEAKNNKESLERKLTTAKSQSRQAIIKAPFSGNIDAVIAKTGEMAQPGTMLFRIVNPNDIHISADVSERFIGKFENGDEVTVYFPSQEKRIVSKIKSIGQVINSQNRTFELEVALPSLDFPAQPNQVVVLTMKDYKNSSTFKIPTKLIQKDRNGNYVYQLTKVEGQSVANKLYITAGKSYNGQTEILSGLKTNQKIVFKGYRELSEGIVVKVVDKEGASANANTAKQ
jgi:RND family efflux transporter MFP subunit